MNVPYGHRMRGGAVEENPEEQEQIKLIVTFREEGLTFQKIADRLDKMGFVPRKSPVWRESAVRMVHANAVKNDT